MVHRGSYRPGFARRPRVADPTSRSNPIRRRSRRSFPPAKTSPPRQIAVPANGSIPGFDNVYTLAIAGAPCDEEVPLLCETDEGMSERRRRQAQRAMPANRLTLLDVRLAGPADRPVSLRRRHDLRVLAGIHAALRYDGPPLYFAGRPAETMPAGRIVLA